MQMTKIGIIREGKTPPDRRVPLTPMQAKFVKQSYHEVNVVCQTSNIRCFSDNQYSGEGIEVVDNLDDCDIVLGVKEVALDDLADGKIYLFFLTQLKSKPITASCYKRYLKKE